MEVRSRIVAIEPQATFREELIKKGYETYAYAEDAVQQNVKVDIAVSFDVIEHVDDPFRFIKDVYELLNEDGRALIGTPTDSPVLRRLVGHTFEQFHFRFQHPWIFSADSLHIMAKQAGFKSVRVEQKQLYGLSNLLLWLSEGKPCGNSHIDMISNELEEQYKKSCENLGLGDYLLLYMEK